MQILQTIDIFNCSKTKNLISSREIIKRKRAATNWEKMCAIHITNRDTISITCKNQ